jgi:fatty-acyl-CoA synthase
MYTCLGALVCGGQVVFLPSRSYQPDELAATIGLHRVDSLSLVGDVFARPLADALDRAVAAGCPYDMSSLRRIVSVGVTWSADVKLRFLAHADVLCRDVIAASEGGPFAICETRRGDDAVTSRFVLAPRGPGHRRAWQRRTARLGCGRHAGLAGSGRLRRVPGPGQPGDQHWRRKGVR